MLIYMRPLVLTAPAFSLLGHRFTTRACDQDLNTSLAQGMAYAVASQRPAFSQNRCFVPCNGFFRNFRDEKGISLLSMSMGNVE